MKVLHINSYYNGCMFYKNLYDSQIENGIDLEVFVPVSSPLDCKKDLGPYSTISHNHNYVDRFLFRLKQNKIYNDLKKKYDICQFDIVHAHSLFTNGYAAMLLKKEFNIPYIVAIRNTDINIFFKKAIHLRRTGINILRMADSVIFLSKAYKTELFEKYISKNDRTEFEKKTYVIPNGIDDFWFKNINIKKQKPLDSKLRLLQVGDINKNKNIITTVKAIELMRMKGHDIVLNVVGKIKDQDIFNQIKDLSFVNYLGFKSKEELILIYRQNDIFVMPSKNETFGLVYAEAMSQGLPVIYTKGQGFDGQFNEGVVGYAVKHDSDEQIFEAIYKILCNYSEISSHCIENCSKFNWNNISDKYTQIYDSCIADKGDTRSGQEKDIDC